MTTLAEQFLSNRIITNAIVRVLLVRACPMFVSTRTVGKEKKSEGKYGLCKQIGHTRKNR